MCSYVVTYLVTCVLLAQGGLITALTVVERPQLITGIVLSAPAMLDDRATSFQVS